MRHRNGFTLIELMLALAVVGVLFAVALPALGSAFEATRANAAESALLSSLVRASNRAALTGTRSVLCPSADGTSCAAGADWTRGWIAFTDPNADRERSADERLLSVQTALEGRVRLRSSDGRTRIVFQGNGGNAGSNVTWTLCDGRGPAKAVTLVMSNTGRLRHGTPTALQAQAACAS